MKLLGIEFVPINLPLKVRLETVCIFVVYLLFPGLTFSGPLLTIYVLFYTHYWLVAVAYLFWAVLIDSREVDCGTRKSKWICSWSLFKHAANYFPIKLTATPGFELNPRKNYMACVFPHGWLPTGVFIGLQTDALGASKIFPHHALHGTTFWWLFYTPLVRETLKFLGMCSVAPNVINKLLSNINGGKIVGIIVGGAEEVLNTRRGHYHLTLKNRKGFVKLALKNGAPLIPVFSFGETGLYNHVVFPKESLARRLQDYTKAVFGVPAFVVMNGRGFLQYTFGLLPHQKPINVVAGKPIEFEKKENPTQQDIDSLHELFITKLTELFEEYKYKFEENPENVKLVIS